MTVEIYVLAFAAKIVFSILIDEKESEMKAHARHILVDSKEQCESLISDIEGGADFADLAAKHSQCPSGKQGGDLGEFGRGQMVPEFDEVVFSGDLGKPLGPVQTQFGYHVIEVVSRS